MVDLTQRLPTAHPPFAHFHNPYRYCIATPSLRARYLLVLRRCGHAGRRLGRLITVEPLLFATHNITFFPHIVTHYPPANLVMPPMHRAVTGAEEETPATFVPRNHRP